MMFEQLEASSTQRFDQRVHRRTPSSIRVLMEIRRRDVQDRR